MDTLFLAKRDGAIQGKNYDRLRDEAIIMYLFDSSFVLRAKYPSPENFVSPYIGDRPDKAVFQKYGWGSRDDGQERVRQIYRIMTSPGVFYDVKALYLCRNSQNLLLDSILTCARYTRPFVRFSFFH